MLQTEKGTLPTQQYTPRKNCMVASATGTGTSWPPWKRTYVTLYPQPSR